MKRMCALPLVAMALSGCMVMVPGHLYPIHGPRFTNNPSDVANCTAVGNLPRGGAFGEENASAVVRNDTIGLGGNTALLAPGVAIAYECP
jgi:hypothetical protein